MNLPRAHRTAHLTPANVMDCSMAMEPIVMVSPGFTSISEACGRVKYKSLFGVRGGAMTVFLS